MKRQDPKRKSAAQIRRVPKSKKKISARIEQGVLPALSSVPMRRVKLMKLRRAYRQEKNMVLQFSKSKVMMPAEHPLSKLTPAKVQKLIGAISDGWQTAKNDLGPNNVVYYPAPVIISNNKYLENLAFNNDWVHPVIPDIIDVMRFDFVTLSIKIEGIQGMIDRINGLIREQVMGATYPSDDKGKYQGQSAPYREGGGTHTDYYHENGTEHVDCPPGDDCTTKWEGHEQPRDPNDKSGRICPKLAAWLEGDDITTESEAGTRHFMPIVNYVMADQHLLVTALVSQYANRSMNQAQVIIQLNTALQSLYKESPRMRNVFRAEVFKIM